MTTWYLSPTGSDTTGAGSVGNPWFTLSKAITSATTGDSIVLAAGTYTYAASYDIDASVKALTITGAGVDATTGRPTSIIDCTSTYSHRIRVSQGAITMTDVYFKNLLQANNTGFIRTIFASGAGYAAITFTRCAWYNVQLASTSTTEEAGGFYSDNSGTGNAVTFDRCIFDLISTKSGAVESTFLRGRVMAITIKNCRFYLQNDAASLTYFMRQTNNGTWTVTITNSIIYTGISRTYKVMTGGTLTETYTYSCLYNWTGLPTLGTGSITSDPLYVDAPNGILRVRPTSPCKGTGTIV